MKKDCLFKQLSPINTNPLKVYDTMQKAEELLPIAMSVS